MDCLVGHWLLMELLVSFPKDKATKFGTACCALIEKANKGSRKCTISVMVNMLSPSHSFLIFHITVVSMALIWLLCPSQCSRTGHESSNDGHRTSMSWFSQVVKKNVSNHPARFWCPCHLIWDLSHREAGTEEILIWVCCNWQSPLYQEYWLHPCLDCPHLHIVRSSIDYRHPTSEQFERVVCSSYFHLSWNIFWLCWPRRVSPQGQCWCWWWGEEQESCGSIAQNIGPLPPVLCQV